MDTSKLAQYILFPGIIFHEMAHAFACVLFNVPIKKIKWVGKDGGYVIHENSKSYKIIIIALFPFLFNIFISLIFARIYLLNELVIMKIISVWLASSALFFCVPSNQDNNNCISTLKESYTKKQSFLGLLIKILLFPIPLTIIIICNIFKFLDKFTLFRVFLIVFWFYLFII